MVSVFMMEQTEKGLITNHPIHLTLNVVDGRVSFGEWQRVLFIELDHARNRKVQMQILGE